MKVIVTHADGRRVEYNCQSMTWIEHWEKKNLTLYAVAEAQGIDVLIDKADVRQFVVVSG